MVHPGPAAGRAGRAVIIRVECYAGHRGEEAPRRLWIDGRELPVVEVIDRWLDPNHRYFKLLADDGDTYIVRHDAAADIWELTMFKASGILSGRALPGG